MAIFTTAYAAFKGFKMISSFTGVVGPFWNKYKKEIIVAIIIVALGGYNMYLSYKLDSVKAELVIEKANYTELTRVSKANESKYLAAIAIQNAAVAKLAEKLKIAQGIINASNSVAEKANKKHRMELAKIRNEQKPEGCEAAIKYLGDGIGDLTL